MIVVLLTVVMSESTRGCSYILYPKEVLLESQWQRKLTVHCVLPRQSIGQATYPFEQSSNPYFGCTYYGVPFVPKYFDLADL